MTAAPQYTARRATVEDLPQLISLWQLEQLPAGALEKRFTEFQVVSDETGQVLAALGLHISGPQGLLHSESIAQPELGDKCRELLWNRLQVQIHNHALERLWIQTNVPFWRERGFEPLPPEQAALIPAAFQSDKREWYIKTLRTADANAAIEKEFARLKALQQHDQQKLQNTVTWLKRAAVVALLFLLCLGAASLFILRYVPKLTQGH